MKSEQLKAQMEKNEQKRIRLEQQAKEHQIKLKELIREQRSMQMKIINAERTAIRKRRMRLGEILENYMHREIDPDVFSVFLYSFGLFVGYKKPEGLFSSKLYEFYEEWLEGKTDHLTSRVNANPVSITNCVKQLNEISLLKDKRRQAVKNKDTALIAECDARLSKLKREIGLIYSN